MSSMNIASGYLKLKSVLSILQPQTDQYCNADRSILQPQTAQYCNANKSVLQPQTDQ